MYGFPYIIVCIPYSRVINQISTREKWTTPQVFYIFVHKLGILPLCGTTSETHMRQDIAAFQAIEDGKEVITNQEMQEIQSQLFGV